jgi:hypothetical protein
VALVDGAPGGLRTLSATMRRWEHPERVARARDRLDEGPGTIHAVLRAVSADDGRPVGVDDACRVWFTPPNRWRIEHDDEHHGLDISDGRRRWLGFRGFVTERGRGPELAHSGDLGRLLDPSPCLGLLAFDDVVADERSGRPCLRAVGRPRAGWARGLAHLEMLTLGGAGLEHRFWFDAAHGFVLRHEGLVDGEPAIVTELTDVVVDAPVPAERFEVPAGTTIRTEAQERARLLEAASPGGGWSLDDRVRQHVPWGPPPDDESGARAAVTAAFEAFGATGPDGRDLLNVQAGHGLGPLLDRARRRLPGATAGNTAATVDALRFLTPDHAAVWFTIEVAGQRTPAVGERLGRAVRVDGRWLVEHATVADLLAFGGIGVPAPEDRGSGSGGSSGAGG